jgi:hypothetical protein
VAAIEGTLEFVLTLFSGCDHDVEISTVLRYYAASCGNCLDLRYGSGLSFLLGPLTLEDGTDTLSRNADKQLPHDAASYPQERISPVLRYPLLPKRMCRWQHRFCQGMLLFCQVV